MKTQKAIKILNEQTDKLMSLKLDDNNQSWVVQTSTYIEMFFGKESSQLSYFIDKSNYLFKETARTELNTFLNDCIEVISNKGLYKPPKQNVLSRIPDWSIIPIITGLLFIGGVFGRYQKDIAFIRMEKRIETLKDSISIISTNNISEKVKNNANNPTDK